MEVVEGRRNTGNLRSRKVLLRPSSRQASFELRSENLKSRADDLQPLFRPIMKQSSGSVYFFNAFVTNQCS